MQDKLERLIKIVYKSLKSDKKEPIGEHPDEEIFVSYLEGKTTPDEDVGLEEHFISCSRCAEILETQLRLAETESLDLPPELLDFVESLRAGMDPDSVLEIFLKFKDKLIEILRTTGDVLVGQELVPVPILRSRTIKDFKDEVIILKDFKGVRIEVKIENKSGKSFNLNISAKEKETQQVIKDLRITLIKGDVELESYLADTGSVIFEHVQLGKYKVEISTIDEKLASVLLDINI